MKLLEKIITKRLRKDSYGKTIFYPWGDFGSGFLVDSPGKEKKIRNFLFLSLILQVLFLAFIILWYLTVDLFSNPLIFLILFAAINISLLWRFFSVYYLTRNLKIFEKRPSYLGSLRKRALNTNIIIPILGFVLVVYFLVGRIKKIIPELGRPWQIAEYFYHGFFLVLFIWALFVAGYMIFIRISKK